MTDSTCRMQYFNVTEITRRDHDHHHALKEHKLRRSRQNGLPNGHEPLCKVVCSRPKFSLRRLRRDTAMRAELQVRFRVEVSSCETEHRRHTSRVRLRVLKQSSSLHSRKRRAVEHSGTVITMLPSSPQVRSVY